MITSWRMFVTFSASRLRAFIGGNTIKQCMAVLSLPRIHCKANHTFSQLIKPINLCLHCKTPQKCIWMRSRIGLLSHMIQGCLELIRDAGLTYKMLRKAAAERDEEARQKWQDFICDHLVATMIITINESSKDDCTIF
ncbi:hypothetical protein L208DRAFT_1517762, partial [Tricholoma matsutake]